ncbi:MAG: hypothetical protein ACYTFA_16940 [Planctomycetota bacterium]
MFLRKLSVAVLIGCLVTPVLADDVLYRYEGDVLPHDPSAGWEIYDVCEGGCTESVQNGRFVLTWIDETNLANYAYRIAASPDPPPPSLWVEWRFLSDEALGEIFFTCDGRFSVKYGGMLESVYMFGDAAFSFSGNQFVTGLDINEFHTYRYESLDGINYRISVDGLVFILDADNQPFGVHRLQLRGTPPPFSTVNRWDFVRYGTISFGERIIASDPPSGYLDPGVYSDLDRFTVTFDAANYVYIDNITVEVTGGIAPAVIQTRRRETDDVDTVEIVLDRALPSGELTRFTFNDGETTNIIEYWFDGTVSGACCNGSDGSCLDLTSEGCTAVTGAIYRGDDTSCQGDNNSNGHDDACDDLFPPIPAVSSWGLIIMTLLGVAAGSVILLPRPKRHG